MKTNWTKLVALATLMIALFFTTGCNDGNKPSSGDENPAHSSYTKKHDTALLLVTFGSTYDVPKATYEKQLNTFKKAFPNADAFFSYTSRTIINREQVKNKSFFPPQLWLKSFLKNHYKKVYVQSLHVIPGEEYTLLRDAYVKKEYNVQLVDDRQGREDAVLGTPLLYDDASIERVAKILVKTFEKELKAGEVVAFMGHGNPESDYDHANIKYKQLEEQLQKVAKANYNNGMIYVATVDYPKMLFDYLQGELNALNLPKDKKIISLHPLMTIFGDHASNDMSGDETEEDGKPIPLEDQSWMLQLQADGWKVKIAKRALGDYDEINQIFLDHLKMAIKQAKEDKE